MGRQSFQKMMHCLTVSLYHIFFVGDDVFALKKFIMKPYSQQSLTADKRIIGIVEQEEYQRIRLTY